MKAPCGQSWNDLSNKINQVLNYNPACNVGTHKSGLM